MIKVSEWHPCFGDMEKPCVYRYLNLAKEITCGNDDARDDANGQCVSQSVLRCVIDTVCPHCGRTIIIEKRW